MGTIHKPFRLMSRTDKAPTYHLSLAIFSQILGNRR